MMGKKGRCAKCGKLKRLYPSNYGFDFCCPCDELAEAIAEDAVHKWVAKDTRNGKDGEE